jgi:Uma2 family endonuclease
LSVTSQSLPLLVPGQRMTVDEFHEAYSAYPDHTKFELLDGVVHMASPVRYERVRPHTLMTILGGVYSLATAGTEYLIEQSTRFGFLNEVQPDGILRILESHGGQSQIENGRLINTPELIIEVSSTSLAFDLREKYAIYHAVGVLELLIIDVNHDDCYWFDLCTATRLTLPSDGICRVKTFPGCWFNLPALYRGDGSGMQVTMQQGLASPEHAAFVDELAKRRTR